MRGGANDSYLGKRYLKSSFVGLDCCADFLKLYQGKEPNVRLEQGDLYNLPQKYVGTFDGVICLQVLSWLEDYKEALTKICELDAQWIAFSSLFYEGRINYYIRLDDHEENGGGERYYNIYSLPLVQEYLAQLGYHRFEYKKFDIDIDLPRKTGGEMGTYTLNLQSGERLQISGALLMPWYFVLAKK